MMCCKIHCTYTPQQCLYIFRLFSAFQQSLLNTDMPNALKMEEVGVFSHDLLDKPLRIVMYSYGRVSIAPPLNSVGYPAWVSCCCGLFHYLSVQRVAPVGLTLLTQPKCVKLYSEFSTMLSANLKTI